MTSIADPVVVHVGNLLFVLAPGGKCKGMGLAGVALCIGEHLTLAEDLPDGKRPPDPRNRPLMR